MDRNAPVVSCEARVLHAQPLPAIGAIVDEVPEVLSADFEQMYSRNGRPSRASLLQAFFPIRSERQLTEQLDFNLMLRWFVGLSMNAPTSNVMLALMNKCHV